MDWDVVSSVASAIAVVVAMVGLVLSHRSASSQVAEARRQMQEQMLHDKTQLELQLKAQKAQFERGLSEQRYAPLRHQLLEAGLVARRLSGAVGDGSAAISACRYGADAIVRAALGSTGGEDTDQVVRRFLLDEPPALGGGRVPLFPFLLDGWERSPSASRVTEDCSVLRSLATAFDGDLAVIRTCASMVDVVVMDVRDVYPRALDGDRSGDALRRQIIDALPVGENDGQVSHSLSVALSSSLSLYIVHRNYPDLLEALASFIATAGNAFADLDTDALDLARRSHPPLRSGRVEQIAAHLDEFDARALLPLEVRQTLRGQLETVQACLSSTPSS